jgi:hypothetical protein
VKLGKANVDKMLRKLTAKQFRDWEIYASLEPFNELRQDYRIASLAVLHANLHRDPKTTPYTIEQFLLNFEQKAPKQGNTRDMQIMMIKAIANLYSSKKVKDIEE